jgi:hypothetical protein
MPYHLGRKPGSTCRESKNGTRALGRAARHGVKTCASEALAGWLDDTRPTIQMAAARELLERALRQVAPVATPVIDNGAAQLETLRELAERGLRNDQPKAN